MIHDKFHPLWSIPLSKIEPSRNHRYQRIRHTAFTRIEIVKDIDDHEVNCFGFAVIFLYSNTGIKFGLRLKIIAYNL